MADILTLLLRHPRRLGRLGRRLVIVAVCIFVRFISKFPFLFSNKVYHHFISVGLLPYS